VNKLLFGFQFLFFFYFYSFFGGVITPSKQMNHYLRNREAINERRRELYKLKRYNLSNPIPLNCNKDSSFQVEVYQTDTKHTEFLESTMKFESIMQQCTFSHCIICRQQRLGLQTVNGICTHCNSSKHKLLFGHENKALPTWIKDNEVIFDLPKELSHHTMAEKLLIQRVSPLVPVIHIKNGILGVQGHIVSFFQDVSSITTILPRLPSEVSIVKVIHDSQTRCGSKLRKMFIGPQGTSIVKRSPRVCRIPYKSGQLFSHFLKKNS
jgi:gamma-glutamylcyclotransferase (GGCT)/AIG2-like uncharacterized protein YtfP